MCVAAAVPICPRLTGRRFGDAVLHYPAALYLAMKEGKFETQTLRTMNSSHRGKLLSSYTARRVLRGRFTGSTQRWRNERSSRWVQDVDESYVWSCRVASLQCCK